MTEKLPNYVRTYRKKAGLSQRELGLVLGYLDDGQVARHETFDTVPPLEVALRYEAAFHIPVSQIFGGLYESAQASVRKQMTGLEKALKTPDLCDYRERRKARKLQWLLSSRNGAERPRTDECLTSTASSGVRPQAAEAGIRRL